MNVFIFKKSSLIITFILFFMIESHAQSPATYPRVTGYFSILNPIGAWTKNGFTSNFKTTYSVGFPFGMNLLKSERFGISFEVAPTVRTEKSISKINSILFHPGAMFRFQHGFTFIGRMAFETNGRYGLTPVFNKVIRRGKDASLFLSVPIPVRFGNDMPVSFGTGLQVGVSF